MTGPNRDAPDTHLAARWQSARDAIAYGAMAATTWGPAAAEDPELLDDLTEQYLAQADRPAGAPLPASAEQHVGPPRPGQAYRYPEQGPRGQSWGEMDGDR